MHLNNLPPSEKANITVYTFLGQFQAMPKDYIQIWVALIMLKVQLL